MTFSDHIREPKYNPYILYTKDFADIDVPEGSVVVRKDALNAEDARALIEIGTEGSDVIKRVFIFTKQMNVYAQNALLKLFEDIQGNLIFYLVLPENMEVLDTLKSRCYIVSAKKEGGTTERVKEFKKMSEARRLEVLDSIWKECVEGGNKNGVVSFLNEIEVDLHRDMNDKKTDKKRVIQSSGIVNRTREIVNSPMATKSSLYSLAFIW